MPPGEESALIDVLAAFGSMPLPVVDALVEPETLEAALKEGSVVARAGDDVGGQPVTVAIGSAQATTDLDPVRRTRLTAQVAETLDGLEIGTVEPDVLARLGALLVAADKPVADLLRRAVRAGLMLGRIDNALSAARLGLRHDPDDNELRHLLAMALEARGEHGAATSIGNADEAAWLGR